MADKNGIATMFQGIGNIARDAMAADPTTPKGAKEAVDLGLALSELMVQDLHRIADALEAIAHSQSLRQS